VRDNVMDMLPLVADRFSAATVLDLHDIKIAQM
jgi:ABC-type phosphate/phosphonate transport system ATPase subunit